MKYSANLGGMLKHDKINNPFSFINKTKKTNAHISSSLSRDVEMIHISNYEEENSCNISILLPNKNICSQAMSALHLL